MLNGNESSEPNINVQYVKLPGRISQNVGMFVKKQVNISDVGRIFDKRQPRKGRSCQLPTTLAWSWNDFFMITRCVRSSKLQSSWWETQVSIIMIWGADFTSFASAFVSSFSSLPPSPFQVGTTIGWGLPGHGPYLLYHFGEWKVCSPCDVLRKLRT